MTRYQLKRIYEEVSDTDGYRVLADRLWPRGVSKERAALDEWVKDLTPSTKLREDYHHHEDDYTEFKSLYRAELAANPDLSAVRAALGKQNVVTLLTAAKEIDRSHLPVLRAALEDA